MPVRLRLVGNSRWKQIRKVAYGLADDQEKVRVKQIGGRIRQSPNPQVGGKPTPDAYFGDVVEWQTRQI